MRSLLAPPSRSPIRQDSEPCKMIGCASPKHPPQFHSYTTIRDGTYPEVDYLAFRLLKQRWRGRHRAARCLARPASNHRPIRSHPTAMPRGDRIGDAVLRLRASRRSCPTVNSPACCQSHPCPARRRLIRKRVDYLTVCVAVGVLEDTAAAFLPSAIGSAPKSPRG